jgi:hypothetical protein
MALEDLPFFFMRWGAHISFLQDAITQHRRCAKIDAWLLAPLVGARRRITCREKGVSWFTDRKNFT